MKRRPAGALTFGAIALLVAGCASLLPRHKEATASPWASYREAQQAFDLIVPGKTTAFMLNQSVTLSDLDRGVQECVMAKTVCRGLEINQRLVKKQRNGSFWLDFLGFKRETHTEGGASTAWCSSRTTS